MLVAPPVCFAVTCSPDSVQVGPTCVDIYEASLWSIPATNARLVDAVQKGKATLADLTAGGATQVGCAFQHAPIPSTFPITGNWTAPIYAASIPGTLPSACVTWFQAQQACALSMKRLLTNEEWQRAAAGTPDSGVDDGATLCNIAGTGPTNTGSRSACVSNWNTYDMVGNVQEYVADWADRATGFTNWFSYMGSDLSVMGGDGSINLPGVLYRGGNWNEGANAGIFYVFSDDPISLSGGRGVRCAR
jgi:formylglycine-generating enzyme required for sulfatase activity